MANVLKMDQQAAIRGLLERGWSYRRIERETGIRRETIARYDPRHPRYGSGSSDDRSGSPNAAKVPTEEAADRDQNRPKCPPTFQAASHESDPDRKPTRISNAASHAELIRQKLELGLTAQRIYQDLVVEEGYGYGYDSVKRFVRHLKAEAPHVFARIHTAPGEEAQVDFGQGAPTLRNGRYRRPWLFKMVLSWCRHSYEEVVWGQDVETFIRCHERAFDAFGGTVSIVVIDNLKSGVLKAHLYDPDLNPAYEAFGRHAGFIPLPCLPGKPEHKGKTEKGIDYTQENALKGLRFESLEAQNAHLRHWNKTWARTRIHGTTKRQVWAAFLEEQPYLQPLVLAPFPYFHIGERKVQIDGFIEVERAYYPVPAAYVGRKVIVHFNRQYVKVLGANAQLIIRHQAVEPGHFQTDTPGLPEKSYSRETYKSWLRVRLGHIGPNCRRWTDLVLKDRDALGLRALRGVLDLKEKYPPERIDEACRVALHFGSLRYQTVAQYCDHSVKSAGDTLEDRELLSEHPMLRPLKQYQLFVDELDSVDDEWDEDDDP